MYINIVINIYLLIPFLCSISSKQERCLSSRVEVIQEFRQHELEGDWFLMQYYRERKSTRCTMISYFTRLDEDRKIMVSVQRRLTNGTGYLDLQSLKEQEKNSNNGKFFNFFYTDYFFVDTDYDNYGVLWTCEKYGDGGCKENLMVISRKINFDVYSSESLNATLAKPPFNRTKLKNADQSYGLCEV